MKGSRVYIYIYISTSVKRLSEQWVLLEANSKVKPDIQTLKQAGILIAKKVSDNQDILTYTIKTGKYRQTIKTSDEQI